MGQAPEVWRCRYANQGGGCVMPKDVFKNGRLTVEYDETDPQEALEKYKKQLKGKQLKDLTLKEKNDLVVAVLNAEAARKLKP